MNTEQQPMDAQPLINALTRQRNEQLDRLAHAEAALHSTQEAFKFEHERAARLQSMLDDTLLAMKHQQELHDTNAQEQERIAKGLREQITHLEDELDSLRKVPEMNAGLVLPPLGALPEPTMQTNAG